MRMFIAGAAIGGVLFGILFLLYTAEQSSKAAFAECQAKGGVLLHDAVFRQRICAKLEVLP